MATTKQNSSTISQIYTSRNIILDLVKERGYDTSDYEDRSISEIQKMYNEKQLDMLMNKEDTSDDRKIFIKYHLTGKIRINQIYEYIDDLYNVEEILTKNDDFIIITKDKPNDTLKKLMNNIWNKDNIYFVIYDYNNYLFNILNHEMVPEHEVIDEKEKDNIKKKYNILYDKQFPEISRFDSVAEAIGLRPDQLCKITRNSPTAIKSVYYRLCS